MLFFRSHVRSISLGFAALGVLWLVYFQLVSAQSVRPEPPARVLDLEEIISNGADPGPVRFLSMRATDAGLFVWVEHGESRLAGSRKVAVYQVSENGGLLRTIWLPSGARLTMTGDFGLDHAGNVYFLQTRRAEARNSEVLFLVKVDPRGEITEEHALPGWVPAFAVGGQGRVWLITNDAEVTAPDAPTIALARGHAPSREGSGMPPVWLPLLEQNAEGELILVDGVRGTFEILSGPLPGEPRAIGSAELQASLQHINESHASQKSKSARGSRFEAALRSSSADERGIFSFTLMGTRPSQGVVVIRVDGNGNSLPSLRLEAPIDTKRPTASARPDPDPEAALMFPHDLAVWRGKAFVLGVHGLLAVYDVI